MLEDVRVTEVAMFGPSALGMHLGDLGARCHQGRRSSSRRLRAGNRESPAEEASRSSSALEPRANGRLTIDLRQSAGAAVFEELVRRSDVVIEGLRPGSLDRRGLGYGRLRKVKSNLVFVSISGFGQNGPYRSSPVTARRSRHTPAWLIPSWVKTVYLACHLAKEASAYKLRLCWAPWVRSPH